jgi:putative ABC transport system substrate-binding protein
MRYVLSRITSTAEAVMVAALLLFVVIVATPTSAEEPAPEWFKTVGESAQQSWVVSAVADDPLQKRIVRKDPTPGAATRRVMVLYPRPSSAYDVAITKMLEVFAEKDINANVIVYNFNKDDARGQQAIAWAESNDVELIFSMGSESTAWLFSHYNGGKIPVVSVCSKDPVMLGQTASYDRGTGTNIAFTSLNMPVEVQMTYVLELMPDLRNFGILVDSTNVSAVETQAKPMAQYAKQRGIQVLDLAIQDPKNAKAELAELVKSAVAVMRKSDPTLGQSILWITGSTSVFGEIATINENSDRVPVLSVAPEVVKAGDNSAALAIGISFESNAHLAAIYGAGFSPARRRSANCRSASCRRPTSPSTSERRAKSVSKSPSISSRALTSSTTTRGRPSARRKVKSNRP